MLMFRSRFWLLCWRQDFRAADILPDSNPGQAGLQLQTRPMRPILVASLRQVMKAAVNERIENLCLNSETSYIFQPVFAMPQLSF